MQEKRIMKMGKTMKLGVFLAIGAIVFFWIMGVYNKMVSAEEEVRNRIGDIEVQYQRRADLIPNLVNIVKGYARHEREVLLEVVEARSKATQMTLGPNATPQQIKQFIEAQEDLTAALSRLLLIVERYPDLKANENFLELQAQLEGTENRIAFARNKYNESVRKFNTLIRRVPGVIIASSFGFEAFPYFEADQGAKKAPKVQF